MNVYDKAKPRFSLKVPAATLLASLALSVGCTKQASNPDLEADTTVEHHHGHSEPTAQAATPAITPATLTGSICTQHSAPKELCFLCDASLRDPDRLWCNEHARYEDRCWECHPEAQEADRPFCPEHGLYEDECFLCRPELRPTSGSDIPASVSAALFCEDHAVPEAECGICRPEVAAQLKPGDSLKVRLPARDSARSAGVETDTAEVGSIAEAIECYAELAFNQNRLAQVVAPVGGIVEEVPVDLGSQVQAGQTVARLWSASIAEAVAKAVLSHQTLDRERRLREQRVVSEQNLQEAEAAHRAACQQLRTLGFTEDQIDALGDQPYERVLLEVRAPFAGEIVERTAVLGTLVEPGKPLFTLVDRSVMWAMLNVPESALGRVRVGQTVELRFDSIPERTFQGRLTWLGAEVDDRSRMARARAELSNPDGLLRAKMFARARILTRSTENALLLPASAIQPIEGTPLVFVKLDDDLFEVRAVQLGATVNGRTEIQAGLDPDDEVAVNHVFPLKSQLLVSRLGAGCAHEK